MAVTGQFQFCVYLYSSAVPFLCVLCGQFRTRLRLGPGNTPVRICGRTTKKTQSIAGLSLTDGSGQKMDPIRQFSLAAVVLLSLVLPLTASAWLTGAGVRRSYLRTVWVGQLLMAVSALWVHVTPVHPEWGAVAAAIVCLAGLPILRRQMWPARPSQA